MNTHLLQSPTWKKYEELEGHKAFFVSGPNFEALAILHSTPVGNYLFCPYGPTLDTKNTHLSDLNLLKTALDSLKKLAITQKAIFVRIEPTIPFDPKDLQGLGLIKSREIDPAHTLLIDLSEPETAILKNMRSSNVQYWRSHEKKGLKIRQTQDPEQITILTSLLQGVSDKNHFTPQDENHLKNQLKSGFATLYIAELDGKPLAASLVYDFNDTRYYAHAATSNEERKLAAGTVLLVQMIVDAKKAGGKYFDFWGMTPSEDKNHPWYGFTQYKKSFGGHQVNYAGTWDLPVNSLRYHLYQSTRKLNRLKRKLFH